MELRKLYSLFSVLTMTAVFASCSTQSQFSRVIAPVPSSRPNQEPAMDLSVAETRPASSYAEGKRTKAERVRAKEIRDSAPRNFVVRTTAYSHQERDSWKYGKSNAAGGVLQHGEKHRSAAADWSRFPLGTRFKIEGLPQEYVIEDYGRALVGSDTIDIYKPSLSSMNQWGTRHVGIEVLEWGSFSESERILKSRANSAPHVRQMLEVIQEKIIHIPEELRNGFGV